MAVVCFNADVLLICPPSVSRISFYNAFGGDGEHCETTSINSKVAI